MEMHDRLTKSHQKLECMDRLERNRLSTTDDVYCVEVVGDIDNGYCTVWSWEL